MALHTLNRGSLPITVQNFQTYCLLVRAGLSPARMRFTSRFERNVESLSNKFGREKLTPFFPSMISYRIWRETPLKSKKYAGFVIRSHRVFNAETKQAAQNQMSGWESVSLTGAEWIAELEQGRTIQPSQFTPATDQHGKVIEPVYYTHALEYWQGTHFICADADHIIGVEVNDDGSEKNPAGVEAWTEEKNLCRLYPELAKECFAAVQSVSSMSGDKPPLHRRYRLIFLFDEMIMTPEHYAQVLLSLADKYSVIPKIERAATQPVFGNAREGFNKAVIVGNILSLSDFPYRKPEPKSKPKPKPAPTKTLREWLDSHKIAYTEKPYKGTEKFIVDCPHDKAHTQDAWITDEGGAWQFSCSHNSCKGDRSTWKAYKSALGITDKFNPARPKRDNPLPKLKDGSDYFVHDEFNVLAMSDYIQSQFTVWAQDAGIYIYDKRQGVYVLGELEIDQAVRKELGILRKKRYTDEVLADLRACCRKPHIPDSEHLIGFKNGVLVLTFGEDEVVQWKAHSPDNYLTTVFPVDFNLNAPVTEGSTDFEAWLTEVLDGDTELVKVCYEAIGSIFHKGSVDMQRGLLLVGEGGTGKSMFLSQIQRLIGRENICARSWGDYGNSDFAFGDLYGKALALDSDIDVSRPLSGAIKPAVTGNILTCNKKYQQPFDFNPFATWIGSINKFPRTRDKTWGFFRRWIVIPFNKTFTTDSRFEALKRKLWSDTHTLSRIILDAMLIYLLAYQAGSFTVPVAAAELSREMYQSANSVISWLDGETQKPDNMDVDLTHPITRTDAYQAYAEYCRAHTFDPENNRSFLSTLRSQGFDCDKKVRVGGSIERVIDGLILL